MAVSPQNSIINARGGADLRLFLNDYLASLKERNELDAILPDLLRAMGYQIIKDAQQGTVEYGIDIAAIKTNESNNTELWLFQVKSGNIGRNWNNGQNSIRSSLTDSIDAPYSDSSRPELDNAERSLVLVYNGILENNVNDPFSGFIKRDIQPHIKFEQWNIDKLTQLLEEHLFSERILPKELQSLLRRTIVFLEDPDYALSHFRFLVPQFLRQTEGNAPLTAKKRNRTFGFIRIMLALVEQHATETNRLNHAITAYEIALMALWDWMHHNNYFGKKVLEEFDNTYKQYLLVLEKWQIKLKPIFTIQNSLCIGRADNAVEYPMRFWHTISNLSLQAISLHHYEQNALSTGLSIEFKTTIESIKSIIENNPASHRPLLDNHMIDISLGLRALMLGDERDFARVWVTDLLENLHIRKTIKCRLPELYNRINLVIEYEATGERPIRYEDSSSTLIYMLYEWCVILEMKDVYEQCRHNFSDVGLQVWYPQKNAEDILYKYELRDGDTETSISTESYSVFCDDVNSRDQQFSPDKDFSPRNLDRAYVLMLASKHYRTPIFPSFWREHL